ncbi:MAG: ribonuclease III [Flammeovirgaceae bacterium]
MHKTNLKEDKRLIDAIKTIAGFSPSNISLYKLAILHSSKSKEQDGFRESNERLEYLGDAILGAAIADYLFKKYPFKDEGFLTEIRSRIVNRESLNNIARKIGIAAIVKFDQRNIQLQNVILGNTLEALVGAIYLDKGYLRAKKFVIDKLVQPYLNLDTIVSSTTNHKSKLLEWSQRQGKEIRFETIEIKNTGRNYKEFSIQVFIGEVAFGLGIGSNKKKAEQAAAEKTCGMLEI